jgi:hypothetical protein
MAGGVCLKQSGIHSTCFLMVSIYHHPSYIYPLTKHKTGRSRPFSTKQKMELSYPRPVPEIKDRTIPLHLDSQPNATLRYVYQVLILVKCSKVIARFTIIQSQRAARHTRFIYPLTTRNFLLWVWGVLTAHDELSDG